MVYPPGKEGTFDWGILAGPAQPLPVCLSVCLSVCGPVCVAVNRQALLQESSIPRAVPSAHWVDYLACSSISKPACDMTSICGLFQSTWSLQHQLVILRHNAMFNMASMDPEQQLKQPVHRVLLCAGYADQKQQIEDTYAAGFATPSSV